MAAVGIVFLLLIAALAAYCAYLLFGRIFRAALQILVTLWPFILGVIIGAAVSNAGAVEAGVFIILAGIVGGVFWFRCIDTVKLPKWLDKLLDDPP